ncbi:hypothetical protein A2886_01755 [candidate division WWE3 bacterium RIFCSPHIGHO2_01_FULL_42_13]|uniref:Cysteine desulfurase n=1 Tax=candidate division WWE3 bacterium RIFCSPHIGHO2_01_FULL_42_13 TaxID=1802617 RepID=A0A1F4UQZ2_UNCKA|nr:MAG: hypothetical protein A2886_01755 [candidate division WWE3 bacterium RIFCSPHIGHO2_01_FULL_42_13]
MFDANKIKKDFPILNDPKFNEGLVYLDNAATSQKPQQVINAVSDYYSHHNANVHRGIYELSERATNMYEDSRAKVAKFISAKHPEEIIFTKGVTESINRVAFCWVIQHVKAGDMIMAMESDHHSNLIPWQQVAERTGAKLEVLQVDEKGEISLEQIKQKFDELAGKIKIVAISHASNVLGTIFPVKEICKLAKEAGAVVSVDGAQAIPHMKVNVESLGCDFYSFSGHKMLAPTGIGVLWERKELLQEMIPYEYGGGMIGEVKTHTSTWGEIPQRFEAGTPNIEGAVGLSAAIDYLEGIGMENVRKHEIELTTYALEKLGEIEGLTILGPQEAEKRSGLVSFIIKKIHPHDIAAILSQKGIAVRSGQHCTMPLHDRLGISASVRASFYIYNTKEDVDKLIHELKEAKKLLS